MDISMYHCAQELATDLHSMIDRNVRDLYTIAFKNNAPPEDQRISWDNVLQKYPKEFANEPIDARVKSLYKKTIGVYTHNILKRKDISSVASTRKFLDTFISNFLRHPRVQSSGTDEPRFFSTDQYSSQKRVVIDVIRTTLSDVMPSSSSSSRFGYSSLTAGGEKEQHQQRSTLGDAAAATVREEVRRQSQMRRLPVVKSDVKRVAAPTPAPSSTPTAREEGATRTVRLEPSRSVMPDESVSCAPLRRARTMF